MQNRTRALLTICGCAAGLMAAVPAAMADDPEPALTSPIQADGTVLAETVRPGESPAGEQTCEAPDLFNPLVAFKDARDYFIAPAGDFENPSLPGWKLTGGAAATAGSLSLPPGSTATTPEMCVDLNYPTFRFFATQLEADTDSDLAIDVVYPALAKDNVREAKKFRLRAKDGWKLSDDIRLEPQRLGKRSGWRRIAIRFRVETGKKASAYRVDDILIDPRRLN